MNIKIKCGIQHTCINFLIFFIITKIECWPVFKQDPYLVLGKKVIILPSFDAGASGQLEACQCQCKIVLKFCLKG